MRKTKTRIQYHRKSSGKTNYRKRLSMLKSGKDRLVIRRTNKYLIAQIIKYYPDGDKVLVSANSKELEKMNWKKSKKNIPASYLTGLMLANKAKDKKIKEAILDLGLQTPIKGSRLYAVVKGVIDGEIKVPCSEEVFPTEERIKGKHIKEDLTKEFESIKNKLMK